MPQYDNPKSKRRLYDPASDEPFRLSRSKIDLFLNCPKCFYLDRRFGIGQPGGYPFSLNIAVDKLLKKEFDIHRANGTAHPLMQAYGVDAVPLAHEKIDEWRDSLRRGITYHHKKTNLVITGGIDDVWVNPQKELIIVDYKATSKEEAVTLDADWQIGYKRQMELYQWLFRQNGFAVSDTGYFVYCNGKADKAAFDGKLEFDIVLIAYKGSGAWIEKTIGDAYQCLQSDVLPPAGADCNFCGYRQAVQEIEK